MWNNTDDLGGPCAEVNEPDTRPNTGQVQQCTDVNPSPRRQRDLREGQPSLRRVQGIEGCALRIYHIMTSII